MPPRPALREREAQEKRRDRPHPCRDAVQPVEQVESVREREEPEQGRDDVNDIGRRHGQDRPKTHQHHAGQELEQKFDLGPQTDDVVGESDDEHERRAHNDADGWTRRPGREPSGPAVAHQHGGQRHTRDCRQRDRDAAEQRSRPLVPPIRRGMRDGPDVERDGTRGGGQYQGREQ